MQVKKILVPVDFSENSNRIIQYGAYVAKQFGAEMAAIFVAQTFQDYSEFFEPHMPVIQFEEDLVASAREKMKSFLAESLEPSVSSRSDTLPRVLMKMSERLTFLCISAMGIGIRNISR